MALCGNNADGMADCATHLPITRRCIAPRTPFSSPIPLRDSRSKSMYSKSDGISKSVADFRQYPCSGACAAQLSRLCQLKGVSVDAADEGMDREGLKEDWSGRGRSVLAPWRPCGRTRRSIVAGALLRCLGTTSAGSGKRKPRVGRSARGRTGRDRGGRI